MENVKVLFTPGWDVVAAIIILSVVGWFPILLRHFKHQTHDDLRWRVVTILASQAGVIVGALVPFSDVVPRLPLMIWMLIGGGLGLMAGRQLARSYI